jgi:DNA polymerase III subunit delta
MSAAALRTLREAIARRTFEPAYYLHGDDDFRKDQALRDLLAAAIEPASRDFNLELLRGSEATPESLASSLDMPPMMASRRGVVVRDSHLLKKDARAIVDRYLSRASPETLLVLHASSGAKAEKWGGPVVAIAFDAMGDAEARAWLGDQATRVHGVQLSDAAARLLLDAVGNDSGQLAAELDKLASYVKGTSIDEAAVGDIVGVRRGETLADFLDRVAMRDSAGALAMVEHVLSLPKSGLVPVIMALTVQTMAMAWGRRARDRGLPAHHLEREYFTLLKETGAYPWRAWGEATKCWSRHLSRWDAPSLEHALTVLFAADRAAKETHLSSPEQMLASIVYGMCGVAAHAQ